MAHVAQDRPVSFLRPFWRMGGWLAPIFGSVLLLLTLVSHLTLGLAQRFDMEGIEARARVIDRYYTESTDSDGDKTITHYLEIDFETDGGRPMRLKPSVGSGLYNRTRIGDDIPVWYLQSDPSRIETRRGQNRSAATVTQVIGAIFGLLMLGALWFPGSKAVAALRARRYGRRDRAEVTGLNKTGWTVNGEHRYRLQWRDSAGHSGESLAYRRDQLTPYRTGSTVPVYHGLRRTWWEGDVGPSGHTRDAEGYPVHGG